MTDEQIIRALICYSSTEEIYFCAIRLYHFYIPVVNGFIISSLVRFVHYKTDVLCWLCTVHIQLYRSSNLEARNMAILTYAKRYGHARLYKNRA